MGSPQASGSPVGGNRLIEHKIGAQFKGAFYTRYSVGDGKDDRLRIRLSPPQLLDHIASRLDVVTVDKNGVELTARDGLTGRLGRRNRFHINGYRLKDPTDNALHFLVTCEEQGFQHHR